MRIKLTSIMVDDQDKALKFYTDVLGFGKKHDIPVGEYRWITVVSPEGPDDLELVARAERQPRRQGVSGGDVRAGHPARRVRGRRHREECAPSEGAGRGVHAATAPMGPVTVAVFADTCGNLIQLYQPPQA